jgi:hypothetical protein
MGTYISSNANRFYVALESAYGQAAPVTESNRFPAVRLSAKQIVEQSRRRDKTGSRTFLGVPPNSRRLTAFEAQTYLTSWNGVGLPAYGPLFQAALGGTPSVSGGIAVASVPGPAQIETAAPHGLKPGSGVSLNGEIRFVTATPDSFSLLLNAPFTSTPLPGAAFAPAATYMLSTALPSVTLYDYWDPSSAVQRLVAGAAVDSFDMAVNGDFHEFTFGGPAADIVDSSTFSGPSAGLSAFPSEPSANGFDYSIVPGHLGQAWIDSSASEVFTLTAARVQVKNHLDVRHHEFGALLPRAIVPGMREVVTHFSLLVQDDAQTKALYQAARARTTIPTMLQLGRQQGQLMGIFLPNVTPEMPNFNDGEARLQWDFQNCLAQGHADDEIYIAFA